jgi:hypothetical protein
MIFMGTRQILRLEKHREHIDDLRDLDYLHSELAVEVDVIWIPAFIGSTLRKDDVK